MAPLSSATQFILVDWTLQLELSCVSKLKCSVLLHEITTCYVLCDNGLVEPAWALMQVMSHCLIVQPESAMTCINCPDSAAFISC